MMGRVNKNGDNPSLEKSVGLTENGVTTRKSGKATGVVAVVIPLVAVLIFGFVGLPRCLPAPLEKFHNDIASQLSAGVPVCAQAAKDSSEAYETMTTSSVGEGQTGDSAGEGQTSDDSRTTDGDGSKDWSPARKVYESTLLDGDEAKPLVEFTDSIDELVKDVTVVLDPDKTLVGDSLLAGRNETRHVVTIEQVQELVAEVDSCASRGDTAIRDAQRALLGKKLDKAKETALAENTKTHDKLDQAIKDAEKLVKDSSGKVSDNKTRTTLESAIAHAKVALATVPPSTIEQTSMTPSTYDQVDAHTVTLVGELTALGKATQAVKDSVTAWERAQQAASRSGGGSSGGYRTGGSTGGGRTGGGGGSTGGGTITFDGPMTLTLTNCSAKNAYIIGISASGWVKTAYVSYKVGPYSGSFTSRGGSFSDSYPHNDPNAVASCSMTVNGRTVGHGGSIQVW